MKLPEGNSQLGWEEQGACTGSGQQDSCEDAAPLLLDRLHSLAEAEKLFDELTQEKLQVKKTHHTAVLPHFTTGFMTSAQEVCVSDAHEVCVSDAHEVCVSDTQA